MASASTWTTRDSCSAYSSDCIAPTSSAAPAWGSRSSTASLPGTADECGPKAKWTTARCSRSHCPQEVKVDDFEAVEILLVEDSDADAELITRALRKKIGR